MTQTRGSIAGIGFAFIAMLLSLPVLASLSPSGFKSLCDKGTLFGDILFFGWMIAVSVFAHLWVICWISGASMQAAFRAVVLLHVLLVIPFFGLLYISSLFADSPEYSKSIPDQALGAGALVLAAGAVAVSIWLPRLAGFSDVVIRGRGRITVGAIGLIIFDLFFIVLVIIVGFFTCK